MNAAGREIAAARPTTLAVAETSNGFDKSASVIPDPATEATVVAAILAVIQASAVTKARRRRNRGTILRRRNAALVVETWRECC
jgi:hypothetical protein